MATVAKHISPVNMTERQKLGLKAGDTVKVSLKIKEKGKTRLQVFEGLVLAVKHGTEPGATFTVRRVSSGVGVEKIFPLYSPLIDSIAVTKRAKVRRSKLYHIREKAAKEIRRQMRNAQVVSITDIPDEEEAPAEADPQQTPTTTSEEELTGQATDNPQEEEAQTEEKAEVVEEEKKSEEAKPEEVKEVKE